ncbi:putative Ig domain-containing protein [Larkinella rosea]|uniref:Dystroglycan-type cadherin-like domain-containing protein n=1 Tax=Larkinella rosea TaxID=2025312 RepID=A0A3P1BAV9_9BACT|nr:putative Ig domain-containing protein [Larkinella rosea]RRA98125.1 hypothetical protein EHT25_31145 [Larkinella rosea]
MNSFLLPGSLSAQSFRQSVRGRRLLLLLLFYCGLLTMAYAQCPTGDVVLSSQEKIDAFPAGCTNLPGSLNIFGDDVSSLSALSGLQSIGGYLSIGETPGLVNLTGLDNLTAVGGDFFILGNASLKSLTGLGKLIRIEGVARITANPQLTNLTGLDNLTAVGGYLGIDNNDLLNSLTALEKLKSLKSLDISYNPKLSSLTGLENLSTVTEYLTISSNDVLNNLTALSKLTSLGGLGVVNNPQLISLTGLDNITTLTKGSLLITSNERLTSLSALSKLTRMDMDPVSVIYSITIDNSPGLTNLTGLDNLVDFQGDLYITKNDNLVSLAALSKLTTLRRIGMDRNPKLSSLAGLDRVTTVTGNLSLESNAALNSLKGLSSLTRIELNLTIKDNPQLSECAIDAICRYLASPPGEVTISNNAPGCNSVDDVQANCLSITQQPTSSSTVCAGSAVAVSVSAIGDIRGYQWYKDGGVVSGQTSATLTLPATTTASAGSYVVVVSSLVSSLTSTAFNLTVSPGPAAPVLSVAATLPILQNTPFVTANITGCDGGTVDWKGSNGQTGSGSVISVPTAIVTSIVYSATCTTGRCASPPGSTTVTISPPLVSGSFDGFVNGADCSTFRGWAWDRNKVNTPVSVDILDGPTVIASFLADVFRQDLQTAGKGNGKHAFSYAIPDLIKDGLAHNLSARVSGSSFILKDSPKSLICQGTGTPSNKAPVPPSPTVLIAPLAAQVGVPFSGTLVAFTDPEGQPLTYTLSGLPDGLSINMTSRLISGTPTVAGTFVLAYSASDGVLTNSVSFPLTVNPASTTTVTGDFEGYLDKLDCGGIRGWVWDRKKPNTPLTVEFYLDGPGTVLGSTVANIYRPDLKDAGKGNGSHAYNFSPPGSVTNGTVVRARVLGSTYELKGSPRAYQCAPARLSAETGSPLQVTVLGNPIRDQLVVEVRGVEGQPLGLQLTDLSGRRVKECQIEQAGAVERQTLSVGSVASGLLVLRVSSGQQSVTLKVLKP